MLILTSLATQSYLSIQILPGFMSKIPISEIEISNPAEDLTRNLNLQNINQKVKFDDQGRKLCGCGRKLNNNNRAMTDHTVPATRQVDMYKGQPNFMTEMDNFRNQNEPDMVIHGVSEHPEFDEYSQECCESHSHSHQDFMPQIELSYPMNKIQIDDHPQMNPLDMIMNDIMHHEQQKNAQVMPGGHGPHIMGFVQEIQEHRLPNGELEIKKMNEPMQSINGGDIVFGQPQIQKEEIPFPNRNVPHTMAQKINFPPIGGVQGQNPQEIHKNTDENPIENLLEGLLGNHSGNQESHTGSFIMQGRHHNHPVHQTHEITIEVVRPLRGPVMNPMIDHDEDHLQHFDLDQESPIMEIHHDDDDSELDHLIENMILSHHAAQTHNHHKHHNPHRRHKHIHAAPQSNNIMDMLLNHFEDQPSVSHRNMPHHHHNHHDHHQNQENIHMPASEYLQHVPIVEFENQAPHPDDMDIDGLLARIEQADHPQNNSHLADNYSNNENDSFESPEISNNLSIDQTPHFVEASEQNMQSNEASQQSFQSAEVSEQSMQSNEVSEQSMQSNETSQQSFQSNEASQQSFQSNEASQQSFQSNKVSEQSMQSNETSEQSLNEELDEELRRKQRKRKRKLRKRKLQTLPELLKTANQEIQELSKDIQINDLKEKFENDIHHLSSKKHGKKTSKNKNYLKNIKNFYEKASPSFKKKYSKERFMNRILSNKGLLNNYFKQPSQPKKIKPVIHKEIEIVIPKKAMSMSNGIQFVNPASRLTQTRAKMADFGKYMQMMATPFLINPQN